jgi:hypothetical protein
VRALAVAILAALTVGAPAASAAGLQPIDLRVAGGEESWHATPTFELTWANPPGTAAVHYRVLDPSGRVVKPETTLAWAATSIEYLGVPPSPGIYTAELWLEDTGGTEGPPVAARLRFDDSAPGRLEGRPGPAWIGRNAFPYTLHLGHPVGPLPLSGIAGYAATIDGAAEAGLCEAAQACGASELELHGGLPGDSLTIAGLPEGTSYLHAVAVSGSGTRSRLPTTTALHVDETDPVTRLAGQGTAWSNQPLKLAASATDEVSGMIAIAGGATPFTAIRIDGGAPVIAAGSTVATMLIESGIHTVAYYARDAAGNVDDGGVSNGRPDHQPATVLVKIDREAPQLAFVGAQDPLDPERIEARASDSLSGFDPDRGSIAVRAVGSGERFVELPTERAGTLLRARWSSEDYQPGEYEFRATAYDRAGNAAVATHRSDGSAMQLPSPLKVATTLVTDLRAHTVPYGRQTTFRGRLVAGRRAPLAGMPVEVIERFDAGALPRERVTTVRTGAGGSFALHLGSGPSREVLAVVQPTEALRGTSSKQARLTVRGDVRLRASSAIAGVGGRPVVFSGKVAAGGAPIPPDGKTVQLQFRLPGLPWSEFRTVHTDARGRFRYAYRFADDDSRGVRFQFRAFAPTQAGWPYQPANSRPVAVRGA